jgi:hypothetical protein
LAVWSPDLWTGPGKVSSEGGNALIEKAVVAPPACWALTRCAKLGGVALTTGAYTWPKIRGKIAGLGGACGQRCSPCARE